MSAMMDMGYGFFGGFDVIFMVMFLIVMGIFAVNILRGVGTWNQNNHSPRLTVPALVTAKRMDVSHFQHANAGDATGAHGYHTSTATSYYTTFQVDSGDRMELAMDGAAYGMLAEGDEGLLTFQGSRYISFERS
ncbi:MAG: DUF2500 domain-containing protein [Lachnospiraceae bacterium]|nr:DUF2500 domain-containing protein [Lachnospiraceae bacterium]